MKRAVASILQFICGFAPAYLGRCYLIPGLRLKLEAEPLAYFLASIRHGVLLKSAAAALFGLLLGSVPLLARRPR